MLNVLVGFRKGWDRAKIIRCCLRSPYSRYVQSMAFFEHVSWIFLYSKMYKYVHAHGHILLYKYMILLEQTLMILQSRKKLTFN